MSFMNSMSVLVYRQICKSLKCCWEGCSPDLQHKCQQITGLQDSNFPLKYLGVPITSSRLTKVECRNLIEKITTRMKIWATKSLSYVGRVMLINTVVFGMFNYWAFIFILPIEAVSKITQLCRNYLWGGAAEFKRLPYVSWQRACLPKAQDGVGTRNLAAWNKALIAKLIWAVAEKKEILWVKWVHGRCLKAKAWWDFTLAPDSSWYWKKICYVNDLFKPGCINHALWNPPSSPHYKVK